MRGARAAGCWLAAIIKLPGPGNWYAPTVYADVNHSMELMREVPSAPLSAS